MKKSIYKVTAWSLVLTAGILYTIHKNNMPTTLSQNIQANINEPFEENSLDQECNSSIDYGNAYANNTNNKEEIDYSLSENSAIATPKKSNNEDVAVVSGMSLLENENNKEYLINDDQVVNQDALAKGGPNSSENTAPQQFNDNGRNSSINAISPNASTSTVTAPVNNARIASPTVVTAPANPSGTSGGGGAGDPFVPIDDYYGLIFLIVVSTLVGVFTIKKSKII